jgi:hypothetical protein
VAIFGGVSPHPKIPFLAAGLGHEIRPHLQPQFRVLRRGNSGIFGRRSKLFRIESERLKLSAPFGRRITEPFDADAAGQATFDGCFDKIGREEGE